MGSVSTILTGKARLFSLTPGAGKEWYDSRPNGSGWSWKDFAWDAAGAASGIALWNLSQQLPLLKLNPLTALVQQQRHQKCHRAHR